MESQNSLQLASKAKQFALDCSNNASDEISRIIAGMISIIDGNDQSLENMKNQKWFERIWFDLTGKNKATVREMQMNRDLLTKYTIQILVQMNCILHDHSECLLDLYRALAVVRNNLNTIPDIVEELGKKLNDKINSLDNYTFVLNEIRNHKYKYESPLISLIDVMSMIDRRTACESRKMNQLKETLETEGINFSQPIDIFSYSKNVITLSEECVGRIFLFCKCYSFGSRILKYTCELIEEYYYRLSLYDRQQAQPEKIIGDVLNRFGYETDSQCKGDILFEFLNDQIVKPIDSTVRSIPLNSQQNIDVFSSIPKQDVNTTESNYQPHISFPILDYRKASESDKIKANIIIEKIGKIIENGKGCYSVNDVYNKSEVFESARKHFGFRATGLIIGLIDISNDKGTKGFLFTTNGIATSQSGFIRYKDISNVKQANNQIIISGTFKKYGKENQIIIKGFELSVNEFVQLINHLIE